MTDTLPDQTGSSTKSPLNIFTLAMALFCGLVAAVAPMVIASPYKIVFEGFGAELPFFTTIFVHYNQFFWLIPFAVLLAWFVWPKPRQRSLVALLIGIISMIIVVSATYIAMYLPIWRFAAEQQ